MQQASKQLTPKVEIVPIEVTTQTLSSDQVQKVDIFFGRYYVASNIGRFIAFCSKPFVAGDISNVTKGAVACISPDSRKLGKIAAAEYLYPNLLQGRALNDMIIKGEKEPVTAINLSVARKYGITINDQVIQEANKIIK